MQKGAVNVPVFTQTKQEEQRELEMSRQYDKQLEKQNQTTKRTTKVLVVGGQGSGKSTLMKQLRLHFDRSRFSFEHVMTSFGKEILQNLTSALLLALQQCRDGGRGSDTDQGGFAVQSEPGGVAPGVSGASQVPWVGSPGVAAAEAQNAPQAPLLSRHSVLAANILLNNPQEEHRMAAAFILVQDAGLQEFWLNSPQVPAGVKYQLQNAQRLIDGKVNAEDYLNSSAPLYFTRFQYRQNDYVFVNNGRNLSQKWAEHFRDVSAVVFVVDINGYFQKDPLTGQNLLLEQMQIFDQTVNGEHFAKLPVILLLNKYDQFKVNVFRYPLRLFFPDFKPQAANVGAGAGAKSSRSNTNAFDGSAPEPQQTEDEVREYISTRFKTLNRAEKTGKRIVYPFAVNVIDEEVVRKLVDTVTAILQKEELRKIGFK